MNLFLGAQQQNLKIHICSFEVTNPMLRQASDVTGGVHKEIHNVDDVPDFFTVSKCLVAVYYNIPFLALLSGW